MYITRRRHLILRTEAPLSNLSTFLLRSESEAISYHIKVWWKSENFNSCGLEIFWKTYSEFRWFFNWWKASFARNNQFAWFESIPIVIEFRLNNVIEFRLNNVQPLKQKTNTEETIISNTKFFDFVCMTFMLSIDFND